MKSKKSLGKWLLVLLVVLVAVLGGTYYHLSHAVESRVPGNAYSYTSVSKTKTMYVAFSADSNHAVVNSDKSVVVKAQTDQTRFDKIYEEQTKNGDQWQYKAEGNKLTLADIKDDQVSQWQYNGVLATGGHLYAHGFSYQISGAGQGKVGKWVTFTKLN